MAMNDAIEFASILSEQFQHLHITVIENGFELKHHPKDTARIFENSKYWQYAAFLLLRYVLWHERSNNIGYVVQHHSVFSVKLMSKVIVGSGGDFVTLNRSRSFDTTYGLYGEPVTVMMSHATLCDGEFVVWKPLDFHRASIIVPHWMRRFIKHIK